jgi:hypothetical protein
LEHERRGASERPETKTRKRVAYRENLDNMLDMIDQYLEEVSNQTENLKALPIYRKFISLFIVEAEEKLGRNVWLKVMGSRLFKKVNFKKD